MDFWAVDEVARMTSMGNVKVNMLVCTYSSTAVQYMKLLFRFFVTAMLIKASHSITTAVCLSVCVHLLVGVTKNAGELIFNDLSWFHSFIQYISHENKK